MADYRTDAPQIVKDFLRYEKRNRNLRDKTIDEYYLDLRLFFRFMKQERGIAPADTPFDDLPIDDIDIAFVRGINKQDVNNYIDYLRSDREGLATKNRELKNGQKLGLEATTTRRKLVSIRTFFNYLVTVTDQMETNPVIGAVAPKLTETLPEYLTQEESIALLKSIEGPQSDRDYCIILFSLCCGLRVSEVVGIDIPDIRMIENDQVAYLHIRGKGGKHREVFLPQNCIEALNAYLETRDSYKPKEDAEDALFLSQKHERISPRAVQRLVEKATKQASIRRISPHKLRHTAATMMLSQGVDIRSIQEILGHKAISTTQRYTHVASSELRQSIERGNPLSSVTRPKDENNSPIQNEREQVR